MTIQTGKVDTVDLTRAGFPFVAVDEHGGLLAETLSAMKLSVNDELKEKLIRAVPGEVFHWEGLRVLVMDGVHGDVPCRMGFLSSLTPNEQLQYLEKELAENRDKLDEIYFLKEIMEAQGAELNIAHQQLRESNVHLRHLKEQLEEKQRKMDQDLAVVKRLVEGVFPYPYYTRDRLEIFARTRVANNLGGDFFDITTLSPSLVSALVADVAGHGLPSAMILMMARILFNTFNETVASLDELMSVVHQEVFANVPLGNYIAIAALQIDLRREILRYSIGGLYGGLVLREGETELLELPTNSFALAFMANSTFEATEFPLKPGDKYFFFTDGLLETNNEQGEVFGIERIRRLLLANRHLTGFGLREMFYREQLAWAGDNPIEDDTSLLILEYLPDPLAEHTFRTTGDALKAEFAEFTAKTDLQLADGDLQQRLFAALWEAVRNGAAACARGGGEVMVGVRILRRPRQVHFKVRDTGPGFLQEGTELPALEDLAGFPGAGTGFRLFREVLDELYVDEKGREFNLVKYLEKDNYGD